MSRLTTTYVLPLKDDVEKLKHPPTEYSFIDQDHSVEFVVSRLKEDFEVSMKIQTISYTLYTLCYLNMLIELS